MAESKDKRTGWLAALKPGDTVIVSRRWYERAETVDSITPSGIIRVGLREFRPDGYSRGVNGFSTSLCEPTPERLASVKATVMAEQFLRVRWKDYPLPVLEAVAALLKEHDEKAKA